MRIFRLSAAAVALTAPWLPMVAAAPDQSRNPNHILAPRDDNPSVADFLRRPFVAAIVIGDYLYLDGGEVSQLYDGKNGSRQHPSYTMNTTLSISLKESWTNTSVTMRSLPKTAPLLNHQAVWRDPSSTAFYVWGGVTSYFAQPPPVEIWKFTADASGGGAWSRETPANLVAFSRLVRATDGAWTQSRDVGYFLGGYANYQTDTSVTGDTYLALPGLVEFNMTSGEFTNSSSVGFGNFGTLVGGAAQWVPFGSSGALVFLGGGQSTVATVWSGWTEMDFNNLTLYDPGTKKWYSQETTGSRPTRRQRFCTVGVQGPNKTYEIFLYGGTSSQSSATSDDVYVLSLPGFVFFRASGASTKRADHACALVGKRQMVSVGGTDGFLGFPDSLLDPDPWKQGIGIFDLTAMEWTSRYDANAAAYDSPAVVKEWYDQGGLASVTWSSNEVKALFAETAPSGSSSNPSTTTLPDGQQNSQSADPNSSNSGNGGGGAPVGAIVGGVIGGLVVLAIIGATIFYVRRAKRKQGWPAPTAGASAALKEHKQEGNMYGGPPPQELDSNPPVELPASHGYSELNTPHGQHELPHSYKRFSYER